MAKTVKSKKAKGTRLEVLVAQRINTALGDYGIEARRMPLSGAVDGFEGDISVPKLPITIECKNHEKHNVWAEWEQAVNQTPHFSTPVLVIDKNYNPEPLVIITLQDFLMFVEMAIESGWIGDIKKKVKTSIGGKKHDL